MLDAYTFQGKMQAMTFHGPKAAPIAFTLVLAPDADDWLVNSAARALSHFLLDSANMEEYVSLN